MITVFFLEGELGILGGSFYPSNTLDRPLLVFRAFHIVSFVANLKCWIALSTGKITIRRKSVRETNCIIHWIEIYSVNNVVCLSNKDPARI